MFRAVVLDTVAIVVIKEYPMTYIDFCCRIGEMDKIELENFAIDLYYTLLVDRMSAGLIESGQVIEFSSPKNVKVKSRKYGEYVYPMFDNTGQAIGEKLGKCLVAALDTDDPYDKIREILEKATEENGRIH